MDNKKTGEYCGLSILPWEAVDVKSVAIVITIGNPFVVSEIYDQLKPQYGFCISIVDKDYTRNNFKNREFVWVVFDSEKTALKNMRLFNKMFRTAIEQNAIDEYKRFKQNPMKRPLTYDKLVDNAYDLYDMVDRGEI